MANETNTMLIDFTGVESSNLIEEGVHLVRVKEAVFSKASTGSSQLEVTFEDGNGATRKAWYNLLPQALWKVKGFLETLGIPCEGQVKLSTKVLVGKTCRIVVEPDLNDPKKLTVTAVKAAAEPAAVEAPYAAPTAQPVPVQAPQMPAQPVQQVMSQVVPTPQATQAAPQAPQPAAAPSNLPPWMSSAPAGTVPNGNLPPWMQQQK